MSDMIDFPCSSDWLDHYHRQGLTSRSSGRMSQTEKMLLEEIKRLWKSHLQMEYVIAEIIREMRSQKSHPSSKTNKKRREDRSDFFKDREAS